MQNKYMSNSIHIQNPINNKVLYEIDEITDIQASSIFETAITSIL